MLNNADQNDKTEATNECVDLILFTQSSSKIHLFETPLNTANLSNCLKVNLLDQTSNLCMQCEEGFVLDLSLKFCVPSSLTRCLVRYDDASRNCFICEPGYQILGSNPSCVQSSIIENCAKLTQEPDTCLYCRLGYTLKGNVCVENDNFDHGNKAFSTCLVQDDTDDAVCKECFPLFVLKNDGSDCLPIYQQISEWEDYRFCKKLDGASFSAASTCVSCVDEGILTSHDFCYERYELTQEGYGSSLDDCDIFSEEKEFGCYDCADSFFIDDYPSVCESSLSLSNCTDFFNAADGAFMQGESQTQCKTCATAYTTDGLNQCVVALPYCVSVESELCTACIDDTETNYYRLNTDGACVELSDQKYEYCALIDADHATNGCSTCQGSLTKQIDTGSFNICSIPNCGTVVDYVCTQCEADYVFTDDTHLACVQVNADRRHLFGECLEGSATDCTACIDEEASHIYNFDSSFDICIDIWGETDAAEAKGKSTRSRSQPVVATNNKATLNQVMYVISLNIDSDQT